MHGRQSEGLVRYFLHLTAQTRVTLRSLEEMDLSFSRAAAIRLVQDALFLSVSDQVKQFVRDLPILPKDQVPLEDNCPICLVPFLEILEGMEDILDEEGDDRGVTKLEGCGHIFCRKDLGEWIKTRHGNCPTCRSQFVPADVIPSSLYGEDDASSDGGEYIPPPEGDEDIDFEIDYAADYLSSEAEHWEDDDDGLEPIPLVYGDFEEDMAEMDDEEMWEVDQSSDRVEEVEVYHRHEEGGTMDLESFTDSDDEALEVEWGLTDGESNRSTASAWTDEGVHPPETQDPIVQVSTNNDDENYIADHDSYPQPSPK